MIQKAKVSSIYTFLGTIWSQLAGMFIVWLLVKKLSVEEFGIYNLLLGTSGFLGIASSLGLIPAFQRYLPEFFQKKEYSKFLWTVRFGLAFRVGASVISIAVILLFFDKIGPFFKIDDYLLYFTIFAVGLFFNLQATVIDRALQAMFLHKYVVYANFCYEFIRLCLFCFFLYLGYGLYEVLLIDLFTYLGLLGLTYYYYRLNRPRDMEIEKYAKDFSKQVLLKRVFRYSGFSLFNDIGRRVLDVGLDFFVVSHFLGLSALGYYAFAARIGRVISQWLPSRALRTVVMPVYFARYAELNSKNELNKMFHFLTKLNLFLILPVFTIGAIFGKEIIKYVFDPKYLNMYPIMILFFIHYLMMAFPVAIALQAIEKPEIILIGKFSAIYNIIMGIVLIQLWGIFGMALATTSAMILKKAFEYTMSKKYAGITFPWVGIFKIGLNCCISGYLMVWAKQYATSTLSLAFVCILALFLYLGISFLNKAFLPEERSIVNKMIGRQCFVF